MKKILLVLPIALFSCFSTLAQFTKGDILLGGSVGFSTSATNVAGSNSDSYTSTNFNIGPSIGYFINNKTALGVSIGFLGNYSKNPQSPDNFSSSYNSFSVGIFGRRYFTITDNFFFMMKGDVSFSRGTETDKSIYSIDESSRYSVSAYVTPMLVFFPSPHWGIEGGIGSVGYTHNQNLSTNFYSNTFGLSVSSGVTFGVTYYFRK